MNTYDLDLSYSQFSIFNAGLENPFNDWTEIQVQQGFSMRKESISIKTLSSAGILKISILKDDSLIDSAIRVFEFEFEVTDALLEIATITDAIQLKIKNGIYKIRIQLLKGGEGIDLCYISFLEKTKKDILPRYLKHDDEISRVNDFCLYSKPAL